MGLSRNKVAVPEGAAGTPPFWSVYPYFKTEAHAAVHYEEDTVREITVLVYSVSEDYDMMIKEKS